MNSESVYIATEDPECFLILSNGSISIHRFPGFVTRLANALRSLFLPERSALPQLPYGESALYFCRSDPGFFLRALYLALAKGIRVFQGEFPGYCQICHRIRSLLGGKVIYGSHNVESERMQRLYPELSRETILCLRNLDVKIPQACDAITVVSERDKQQFVDLGVSTQKITVIPNGIDLEGFDSLTAAPLRSIFGLSRNTQIIVFHGAAGYPPNAEALSFLTEELIPSLNRDSQRAALLVIGKRAERCQEIRDVYYTGYVESVAPYLKAADLAVCPLISGGGTRLKILEYFAAEIPVVATPLAVEGLPVSDGKHLILSEREHMTKVILQTDWQSAAVRTMTNTARNYVEGFDWKLLVNL
jgi:glycosyltransferase involved in cell wall biosynthesis